MVSIKQLHHFFSLQVELHDIFVKKGSFSYSRNPNKKPCQATNHLDRYNPHQWRGAQHPKLGCVRKLQVCTSLNPRPDIILRCASLFFMQHSILDSEIIYYFLVTFFHSKSKVSKDQNCFSLFDFLFLICIFLVEEKYFHVSQQCALGISKMINTNHPQLEYQVKLVGRSHLQTHPNFIVDCIHVVL